MLIVFDRTVEDIRQWDIGIVRRDIPEQISMLASGGEGNRTGATASTHTADSLNGELCRYFPVLVQNL